MKKIIYLSCLLFAASFASAQEQIAAEQVEQPVPECPPKAEFGVHVGPTVSLFYNQHPRSNPRKPGKPVHNSWAFGISGQYNFSKMVALRAEANFERKGEVLYSTRTYSKNDNGESFFTNNTGYNSLGYFTLPVTVKLSFGKRVRFFTNVGLYAGFTMTAIEHTEEATFNRADPGKVSIVANERDIIHETKRVDGGLVTGLGVIVPVYKTVSLTFEGRNNLGFVDMNDNSTNFPNGWYNNSTAFLFGLSVGLNKQKKIETEEDKRNF